MRKLTGMITRLKPLALALFFGLLFFSCNQDSIFFDLSAEIEPKDPLIGGSPANIVSTSNNYVYAASMGSSTVYRYRYSSGWSKPYSVPGGIGQLAATDDYLYAISRNNTLYQYDPNTGAGDSRVPGGKLQSVYAAGEMVFVGIGPGAGPYSVVAYNDDLDPVNLSVNISGLLKGAVYDGTKYFIATEDPGGGIYEIVPSGSPIANATVTPVVSGNVKGIISVGKPVSSIIAITKNGTLHYAVPPSSTFNSYSPGGGEYTGAICFWQQWNGSSWVDSLLLLGVKDSSTMYGYREVTLDATGNPVGSAEIPGGSPSTVQNRARYEAALRKHAVFSIRQVPNSPVIFASTQKDGLWSLRNDQWNAEE
jgi:hypothetical protein